MIRLKNADQIAKIRESCQILSGLLEALTPLVQPGITTQDLDHFAEEYIVSRAVAHPSWAMRAIPPASVSPPMRW